MSKAEPPGKPVKTERRKSKVQFTRSQPLPKSSTPGTPPPSSDNENVSVVGSSKSVNKKKSRKLKAAEDRASSEQVEEDKRIPVTSENLDKDISDGSISDEEVPKVRWKPGQVQTTPVCPQNVDNFGSTVYTHHCPDIKLTSSQKISACVRSDDQAHVTTDYMKASIPVFIPPLRHPVDGRISAFQKHREFTDYLRKSGCLKLFGSCVISVYRMWKWPHADKLLEQMVVAMGHQIPARKRVMELTKLKQSLHLKLKTLAKERSKLLEKLDEFQDSPATYQLLDQDDILPPRSDSSRLNVELMKGIFKQMKFHGASHPGETADLRIITPKAEPVFNVLPIRYHDKRMLQ